MLDNAVPAPTSSSEPAGHPVDRPVRPVHPCYDPPRWSTRPKVWERAVEVFHAAIPADDVRFVHRDFDQANLLWSAGT